MQYIIKEKYGADFVEKYLVTDFLTAYPYDRALSKVLTKAEVEKLLEVANTYKDEGAEGIRLVALMELLYATGLRVSELLMLLYSAVQLGPDSIMVKGNGGHERMVPLSEKARKSLADYENLRSHFVGPPADESWLFPSRSEGGHLTRQRFSQLAKELVHKLNKAEFIEMTSKQICERAKKEGFVRIIEINENKFGEIIMITHECDDMG